MTSTASIVTIIPESSIRPQPTPSEQKTIDDAFNAYQTARFMVKMNNRPSEFPLIPIMELCVLSLVSACFIVHGSDASNSRTENTIFMLTGVLMTISVFMSFIFKVLFQTCYENQFNNTLEKHCNILYKQYWLAILAVYQRKVREANDAVLSATPETLEAKQKIKLEASDALNERLYAARREIPTLNLP